MPSTYAHYRFGKLLLPTLPADVRQCIQRFRRMYDLGLHGPDFFFYYNPLMKTAVGSLGNHYHMQTGQAFFPGACAAAKSEAAQAYLYGLLAHYCLDSLCHPYVQKIVDIGECSHVALESEFDRFLMALDKIPTPHTHPVGKHLHLTRGECMTVAEFYPPATGGNISRSISLMALGLRFLSHPNRKLTQSLLTRIKPSICDNMIPETEQEHLAPYIWELKNLYNQALARYPRLLCQIRDHRSAAAPLGEDFAPDFG